GLSQKEIDRRYGLARRKLLKIMKRLKGVDEKQRFQMRNEYYWFSRQPLKQYRLGLEYARKKNVSGYYSQGVGAAMLAKHYAERGKTSQMLYWARLSTNAWNRFFKERAF